MRKSLHHIFSNYSALSVAVIGDYCLDEYFNIDAALNEPSLETGLVAYQCVKNETFPGAAGTVAKNLANLGVGTVYAVGFAGDDGRGLELLRGLDRLGINHEHIVRTNKRVTPAYTKPWITENGERREMSRIDIKNWTITPPELVDEVFAELDGLLGKIDALIIMDQMTEENCGIITDAARERLAAVACGNPGLVVYADSRSRISKFRDMIIKGNDYEITGSPVEEAAPGIGAVEKAGEALMRRNGKPVVITLGPEGLMVCAPDGNIRVPGIKLDVQLDVCGAGDAFTAAFVSACAAGSGMELAARAGNAAAAECCTQLGTSGFITREMIMERLGESEK